MCDEIVNYADSLSTNVPARVASAVSIIFHIKNVRYKTHYYIVHTALLVITLLFITVIVYYHYVKCWSKLKKHIAVLTI